LLHCNANIDVNKLYLEIKIVPKYVHIKTETWKYTHRQAHIPKIELMGISTVVSSAILETYEDEQRWWKHIVKYRGYFNVYKIFEGFRKNVACETANG
jgi:hypothetical protein